MTDLAHHCSLIRKAAASLRQTDAMIDAAQDAEAVTVLCVTFDAQVDDLMSLILDEDGAQVIDQVIQVFGDPKLRVMATFEEPARKQAAARWSRIATLIRTARLERAISRNMDNAPILRDDATGRYAAATDQLMDLLDEPESLQLVSKLAGLLGAEVAL